MVEEDRDQGEESQGFRGTLDSARQAFSRSFDRVTGAEFRRQFEEFTNVVTTTVLGIHRDQSELGGRLAKVERSTSTEPTTPSNRLVKWAFIFSLVAVILGVAALARTL